MNENLKAVLEFLAANPWKSFFFIIAFRPLKLVSMTLQKKD